MEEEQRKPTDPAVTFELEGTKYVLKLKDYRGSDDRKLRTAMNMSVGEAWREALGNNAMDAMAGLLWLFLIRTQPRLRLDTVLEKFSMYDMETVRDYTEADKIAEMRADFEGLEIDRPVDANPEPKGASS